MDFQLNAEGSAQKQEAIHKLKLHLFQIVIIFKYSQAKHKSTKNVHHKILMIHIGAKPINR